MERGVREREERLEEADPLSDMVSVRMEVSDMRI